MSTRVLYVKESDTAPVARAVLRNAAGDPVDLTGAAVKFIMKDPDASDTAAPKVSDSVNVTLEDAAGGEVSYAWQAADLDAPGRYWQEWEVTFVGGEVTTFPNHGYNTVFVTAELG